MTKSSKALCPLGISYLTDDKMWDIRDCSDRNAANDMQCLLKKEETKSLHLAVATLKMYKCYGVSEMKCENMHSLQE